MLCLQLMKRDIDLYGSQDIKLPPSCLLTVWTESSLNPETRLSHALPLSGIDSKTRKIYVRRFLERSDTTNTSGMYGYSFCFLQYIIFFYQKPQLRNQSQRNNE